MGKKVKPIENCKTPNDLHRHAHAARDDVFDAQRGKHNGLEVDGIFIPTGNRPNDELPVGTLRAIIRVFYAHKLVVTLFVGLVAIEVKTGIVSAIVKALV